MKPLKIWSADRSRRHGIVASNFIDLKEKVSKKLCIHPSTELTLVFEEDGTNVDTEYWDSLKDHTKLIVLQPTEHWQPETMWPPEKATSLNADVVDSVEDENALAEKLLSELQRNPAIMVFLDLSDMEVIKDANVDEIDSKMINKEMAKKIQDQCIELYIRKKREDDALQFIELLQQKGDINLKKKGDINAG